MNPTIKVCFWCGRSLSKQEATRDHLLCKFLRINLAEGFGIDAPDSHVRCSCEPCNTARGRISTAYQVLWRFKTRNWDGYRQPPREKKIPDIVKNLCEGSDLNNFRKVIDTQLSGAVKKLCLMEIDEVIRFEKVRMLIFG